MAGMRWADESYVVSFTGNKLWHMVENLSACVAEPQRIDLLGDRGRKKDSNGITTTNEQLTSN